MGLLDELRKLTQPYDPIESEEFEPAPQGGLREQPSAAQQAYESNFGASPVSAPEPESAPVQEAPQKTASEGGGLFGSRRAPRVKPQAQRERTVNFAGSDQRVVLFNPRDFDEAGELANYIRDGHQVLLTLEGQPLDTARRLLDFMSGIAFALQTRMTPVSAKTYFISTADVDMIRPGEQREQPLSDGQSF